MKTKTTHTPGPWTWEFDISPVKSITIRHSDDVLSSHVAKLYDSALCPEHGDYEANARLISMSPDLLDALKGMTRIVEAFSYTTQLGKNQRDRLNAAKELISLFEVR